MEKSAEVWESLGVLWHFPETFITPSIKFPQKSKNFR